MKTLTDKLAAMAKWLKRLAGFGGAVACLTLTAHAAPPIIWTLITTNTSGNITNSAALNVPSNNVPGQVTYTNLAGTIYTNFVDTLQSKNVMVAISEVGTVNAAGSPATSTNIFCTAVSDDLVHFVPGPLFTVYMSNSNLLVGLYSNLDCSAFRYIGVTNTIVTSTNLTIYNTNWSFQFMFKGP